MKLSIVSAAALVALVSAHMEMSYPPPYRSKFNQLASKKASDYITPLSPSGSDYPCKGFVSDFGTPDGASVATWAAGSQQKMTIVGGADHNGGSCQALISVDKGSSWKVIHSYIGNCPVNGGQDFPFRVPGDTPNGDQIFAWTWFNKVGNREMYMNCATVTITGGGGSESVAFNSRPDHLRANTGEGCKTVEGPDTDFPNPGPDVTDTSSNKELPKGSCGPDGPKGGNGSSPPPAAPGPGAGNGGNSGIPPPPPSPPNNGAPPGAAPAPRPIPGLTVDPAGSCGGQFTCINSLHGGCCSKFGFCGTTDEHCNPSKGCQIQFGSCRGGTNTFYSAAPNATSTSSSSFLDGSASLLPSSSSDGRVSVTPGLPVDGSAAVTATAVSPVGGKKVVTKTNTIFSTVIVTPGVAPLDDEDESTSFETTVIILTSTAGTAAPAAATSTSAASDAAAGGDYRRHEGSHDAAPVASMLTYPPPRGFSTRLAGPTGFKTIQARR